MKADSFELDKLQVENRRRVEKAEKMASETEKQSKGQTDRVLGLLYCRHEISGVCPYIL